MANRDKICEVDGCSLPVRAQGMCKNHRQRLLKYGRLEKVAYGQTSHPLYMIWNAKKQKNILHHEWLDFRNFLADIGDKPSDHVLARLDDGKPYGPDNFEWRKIKLRVLPGETSSQYSSRHSKLARSLNSNLGRELNYKYNYGLSFEQVEEILKAQNYLCAICNKPETATYKNTGKVRTLALDHCHKTNKIREFLCTKCNMFLGKYEEYEDIIDRFKVYLERHR